MFCADYAAAFLFHAIVSIAPSLLPRPDHTPPTPQHEVLLRWSLASMGLGGGEWWWAPWAPWCTGAAAGGAAALTLYPFDFVRAGVLQPGRRRVVSACATIPYAAVLFGVYFTRRDPSDTSSQAKCALLASCCATAAEAPFDHAKRKLLGSTRVMLGAGVLYAPFAACMLMMYDRTALRLLREGQPDLKLPNSQPY
eukprot:Hpha_TRINITY_DN28633_c0_g1::TRINITY_DN28633_c0_g1_i1::g.156469::m.156469